MKTLAAVVLGIFAVVAVFALVRQYYGNASGAAAAALPAITGPVAVPPQPVVVDQGPLMLEGTAVMDDSSGLPVVPYIRYTDAKGHARTKQLIFDDVRGCNPGAGDFPCVPSYSVTRPYPQLVTGERIRVEGYIRENRFLVDTLTPAQ